MDPFITTLKIVFGILVPAFALFVLWALKELLGIYREVTEYKKEKLKKQPPFDSIESYVKFSNDTLHIRLVKDGGVIYTGEIDRRDLV